uniref:ribose-5-phosphate isomerase n=1 Tax=Entomoneis paludosa TaxID=265537 RepID=A0A7S2YN40_9STRA|mmetsp:Transcript_39321/g.81642  ORF Transcript_39321/g.81642 Transcript_39321/m.81642 type:complete len:255 (+) Transcript_39321:176-940(+)
MKFALAATSLLATAASAFQPVTVPAATRIQALQMSTALSQDELKKQVGYKAVDDYVKSGMVVGLGTGSTAYFAVERVGEKLKSGELKDIVAIPTSIRTKEQAEELGIPLVTLDTHSKLDVSIDGADEVDPELNLTKGGGGALFREKIVEIVSDKFIVIVDESKICDGLGPGFPIPVEIVPFCHEHTMRVIGDLPSCQDGKPVLRLGSASNNQIDGEEIAVTVRRIFVQTWNAIILVVFFFFLQLTRTLLFHSLT